MEATPYIKMALYKVCAAVGFDGDRSEASQAYPEGVVVAQSIGRPRRSKCI